MSKDREKYGLSGPVKKVLIETAQFKEHDGQMAEKVWYSYTITFNKDGALIEQVNRNLDGSEWRTVYDYSDSGNLLSMRTFDPSGTLNGEQRYIYDAKDRLAAEQHVTHDGTVTTPTTYTHDDAGGKVKIQELDFGEQADVMIGIEGTNTSIRAPEAKRVESRYDDRGEVVEVKVFNTDGALVSRVEITRDERGNPLEETQYVGDVSFGPNASDSCSTEEMEALTEEQKAEIAVEVARLFSPGTAMSRHKHTYDTEGRLIESKLTMMGMEVSRQTFAYDELGNKSEEVSYIENGTESKVVFTREYDEYGNWTRELLSNASTWDAEFGLSTPAHVTRRQITYW
jgi:hypothetical protein